MRFASPHVLWILPAAPVLALWLALALARRARALSAFAQAAVLPRLLQAASLGRLATKVALLAVAAALVALALARPQWGSTLEPVSRRGVDVLLAIDISESMMSEDQPPSRLGKSLEEASRLLDRLEGDRVGLVAFAGSAGVLCPLTLDYNAVRIFLDGLVPDMISYPGSSLAEAIAAAARGFGSEERKFKVLVLFSDGEDQVASEGVEAAAREAAERGVVIHAVGTGTPSGAPIPVRGRDGEIAGYKKDRQGRVVTTRLDETLLARVAAITGGGYHPATASESELDTIAEAIAGMDKKDMQGRLTTRYEERFQVPLAAALAALTAEALLGARRRRRRARAAAAAALVLILWPASARAESAASLAAEGNRLYREGKLTEALDVYRRALRDAPASEALHYNVGNVLYRQGLYEEAWEAYRRAFASPDRALAEGARYNAGNAQFSRKSWQDAIRNYQEALRIDPTDLDAKRNLELALQRMRQEQPPPSASKPEPREDQEDDEQQQQQQPDQGGDRRDPRPQPEPSEDRGRPDQKQKVSRDEAERILDAMRDQDRPPKDRVKTPPPDRRPEKDW